MATPEEIYAKALSDDEEKIALSQAFATREGAKEYLERRGCETTPEEFVEFLRGKSNKFGELSDEELGEAAGGKWCWWIDLIFTLGTSGILCVVTGLFSVCSDSFEGYDLGDEDQWRSGLCTHPPQAPANVNGPFGI